MQCACAVLYCHLWPPRVYHIFSTLSQTRHDFRGKVIKYLVCVLIFSTTFFWNISHYWENSTRYYRKCTYVFMYSTRYSCQVLIKLEFSRHIFERILKYQFSWKSVQWEWSCSMRDLQTEDRHDEAKSRFSQFCERV